MVLALKKLFSERTDYCVVILPRIVLQGSGIANNISAELHE